MNTHSPKLNLEASTALKVINGDIFVGGDSNHVRLQIEMSYVDASEPKIAGHVIASNLLFYMGITNVEFL